MDRRDFLYLVSCGVLGLAVTARAGAARRHWAWINARRDADPADLRRRFAELRAAGIARVLVGGGSAAAYALAREAGLEVHAWMWTLCRGDLMDVLPDCYAVSREGKSTRDHPPYVPYYRFLCPSRPEVAAHLEQQVTELAANDDLAGVHLDYVRYPDVILPRGLWDKYGLVQDRELPEFDFCYCDTCRAAFAAETGSDVAALADPTASAAWRQFRWERVTTLVNRLAAAVHDGDKQITAAVFPTPTLARRLVRQDWPRWNLDAVLPMVYHGFYEQDVAWIESAVREGVVALAGARPLHAGLYLPHLPTDADLAQAVAGALRAGAESVALFGGVRDLTGFEAG